MLVALQVGTSLEIGIFESAGLPDVRVYWIHQLSHWGLELAGLPDVRVYWIHQLRNWGLELAGVSTAKVYWTTEPISWTVACSCNRPMTLARITC